MHKLFAPESISCYIGDMPRLYDYFDYREFIRDIVVERQARNPRYSYRSFALALGLSSSMLLRVVNRQRNLSAKLMPVFVRELKLRQREEEYFSLLVQLDRQKDPSARLAIREKIRFFRREHVRTTPPAAHAFYEHWFTSVIRELLDLGTFTLNDAADLAGRVIPPVTPRQAARALCVLTELDLVEQTPDKTLRQRDKLLSTGGAWDSLNIHAFQKAMAQRGMEALDRFPKPERDISTVTLTLSEPGFGRVKELLEEARSKIMELARSDTDQRRVFQLNIQFFPVSTGKDAQP